LALKRRGIAPISSGSTVEPTVEVFSPALRAALTNHHRRAFFFHHRVPCAELPRFVRSFRCALLLTRDLENGAAPKVLSSPHR
jgi:hypothetical protein